MNIFLNETALEKYLFETLIQWDIWKNIILIRAKSPRNRSWNKHIFLKIQKYVHLCENNSLKSQNR